MRWTRRFWSWSLLLFTLSFFTGTHLTDFHLYFSVPAMVCMMIALGRLFFSSESALRVRGSALTLFLAFFFSSLLGWSILAGTFPPIFHGIMMGIFGAGALFLTYELYWPTTQTKAAG